MNTNKLYIGRLNKVKNVKILDNSVNEIEIVSNFVGYVLVKQNKYNYKDILTGRKHEHFSYFLQAGEEYVDDESLIPFNKKVNNTKKYLPKSKILSKLNIK